MALSKEQIKEFEEALDAGDWEAALKLVKPLAEQGDAEFLKYEATQMEGL